MAGLNQNRNIRKALVIIRTNNPYLTRQQFKTLRGQVLAGDPDGAMKGLQNILEKRRQNHEHPTRQNPGHRAGQ